MRPALLFKKDFGTSVSCKIFTNTFFIENLQWLLLYSWKCARHWWNFMQYNAEVYFGPCQTSMMKSLHEKCLKNGVFSGPYFPIFGLNIFTPQISVFRPNIGKYGPEKISVLDNFHAVLSQFSTILSHLLKKSLMENLIFCAVYTNGTWD